MYGEFHAISYGHLELRVRTLLVSENQAAVRENVIRRQV